MSKVRQTFIDAVTKLGKETITTDDIKNIMSDTGILILTGSQTKKT